MICTCIQHKTLKEVSALLESGTIEMAELRLDKLPELTLDDIDTLFGSAEIPLVATCRFAENECTDNSDPKKVVKDAEQRLSTAIRAGATYVDLEVEIPPAVGKRLRKLAHDCGTMIIRSFHDFNGTTTEEQLIEQLDTCFRFGGDIAKIITTAHKHEDITTVQALYDKVEEGTLIAFCMGEQARDSRMEALAHGAPYTYASTDDYTATAPGQWTTEAMHKALYRGIPAYRLDGIRIPCSKSFAQRAIIAAALSEGLSHLNGYSHCEDNASAISVARTIGAEITEKPSPNGDTISLMIEGISNGIMLPQRLHTGESGLLTRLMIPIAAIKGYGNCEITGEKTLTERPLAGANDIMAAFGVTLSNLASQKGKDVYVPLRVNGRLLPGRAEISGKGGSQLISGLMMALPMGDKDSEIQINDPRSIPYMFITQDVLRKFGIRITTEMEGDEDFVQTKDWSLCTGLHIKIRGHQKYKATDIDLEGDWSSAAPLMVAGAIFGYTIINGLDVRSLQADLTIMDILIHAGAIVTHIDSSSVSKVEEAALAAGASSSNSTIIVRKAPLNAIDVDLNHAPDLFPIVAVLACFCPGQSRIGGVGRLAGKESDRASAIHEMLTRLGVPVSIEGDDMLIEGMSFSRRILIGNLLKGGNYTSSHDHRMVMALRVAELGANSPIIIDDTACVAKSFPNFEKDFAKGLCK